jgi:integration host factor beta subunit
MTKAELVEMISQKINLTKKDTERVVNIVFGSIIRALAQGDKVELRGFGSFRVRMRDSRDGRNPRTGAAVQIHPKKVPFFKAGKELREMVDNKFPSKGEAAPIASHTDTVEEAVELVSGVLKSSSEN